MSGDIRGIPGSIAENSLEETVLNLFSKCKASVDLSNVGDCYRLKSTNKAPQKVIVKLLKRKGVYRVLKTKPSLKNVDVNETGIPPDIQKFVNHSLCKYYKFLWSKCKKL